MAWYVMVAEGTNQSYNHIGVPDSFHPISHHANELPKIEQVVKIQRWHMDRFAAFVKKMAETQDGDGSLLDHSIFLYGSNMAAATNTATGRFPPSSSAAATAR